MAACMAKGLGKQRPVMELEAVMKRQRAEVTATLIVNSMVVRILRTVAREKISGS